MKPLAVAALLLAATALAQPRPPPAPPATPPPSAPLPPMPPMGGGMMHSPPGIPPQVAQRLGIPADTVKKVRDMSLDANEQLIGLEADLKRAQLDLERALLETSPDEAKVLGKLDVIAKAELAVRKNRMGLMLKIRKLLGPDTWAKLEAELPMGGGEHLMMMHGAGEQRREVRIIRSGEGENVEVRE